MELVNVIRSIVFYVGYVIGLVAFVLVILPPCAFLDYEKRYYYLSRGNAFVIWWARFVCGIRYEVEGLGNIPQTPCVVVCNHQSVWETYLMGLLFVPQATVLKLELTRIPVFGWALKMAKPIAIDRSKPALALKQLLKQGAERLANGIWVMIYPEGTRVRPGQRGRYNKGAAMLANKAGAALLPIAHNAGSFWPAGRFLKRPGIVKIIIGKPIMTQQRSRDDIHQEMESWIRQTCESMVS